MSINRNNAPGLIAGCERGCRGDEEGKSKKPGSTSCLLPSNPSVSYFSMNASSDDWMSPHSLSTSRHSWGGCSLRGGVTPWTELSNVPSLIFDGQINPTHSLTVSLSSPDAVNLKLILKCDSNILPEAAFSVLRTRCELKGWISCFVLAFFESYAKWSRSIFTLHYSESFFCDAEATSSKIMVTEALQ